jgi:hypothetical protein
LVKDGVLIYPEGTCFEPHKLEDSKRRLRERASAALVERAEQMQAVLPPRLGGPLALLDEARGLDVVICAHTGLEAAIDFTSVLRGDLVGHTIDVRIERIQAARVPQGEEARALFLYDRWLEVDRYVQETRAMRAKATKRSPP